MMKKLPNSTIKLISSTQVISSIFSAVKELVENAIDAKADYIEVKLDEYGLKKIEVADNGLGIPSGEEEFVAKPHYTSKLTNHDDLANLETLGFRGEAVHSLCSVSNLSFSTKTKSQSVGKLFVLDNNGEMLSSKLCSREQGTTMCCENIFKNFPVRRQFYNSSQKCKDQLKKVEDLLLAYGLIMPELHLILKHNKSVIWQKSKSRGLKDSFISIFGVQCFQHMEILENEDTEKDLKIVLIAPKTDAGDIVGRKSNDRIFIAVNRRPVVLKQLSQILNRYCREVVKCLGSKHPIAVLHLEVPFESIDVNVEPNKNKVILENMKDVEKLLEEALSKIYPRHGESLKQVTQENREPREEEESCCSGTNSATSLNSTISRDSICCGTSEQVGLSSPTATSQDCFMTAVSTPVRISPASIYDSPVCLMNDGANNEFSTPVMDHASLADSLPAFASTSELFKAAYSSEIDPKRNLANECSNIESADSVNEANGKGNPSSNKDPQNRCISIDFSPEFTSTEIAQRNLVLRDTGNNDRSYETPLQLRKTANDQRSGFQENHIEGFCSSFVASPESMFTDVDRITSFTNKNIANRIYDSSPELFNTEHGNNSTEFRSGNYNYAGYHRTLTSNYTIESPREEDASNIKSSKQQPRFQSSLDSFTVMQRSANDEQNAGNREDLAQCAETTAEDRIDDDLPSLKDLTEPQRILSSTRNNESENQCPAEEYEGLFNDDEFVFEEEESKVQGNTLTQVKIDEWSRGSALISRTTKTPLQPVNILYPKGSDHHKLQETNMNNARKRRSRNSGKISSKHRVLAAIKNPILQQGPVEETALEFSFDSLKQHYHCMEIDAEISKSKKSETLDIVGKLSTWDSWIVKNETKLFILNPTRLQELVVFEELMRRHEIAVEEISKPVILNERLVGGIENLNLLENLDFAKIPHGTGSCICDERVTSNGLKIRRRKDIATGVLLYEITHMATDFPDYGINTLKELLDLISKQASSAVNQEKSLEKVRPKAVAEFLKAEAIRLARDGAGLSSREDIADLLNQINPDSLDDLMCPHESKVFSLLK